MSRHTSRPGGDPMSDPRVRELLDAAAAPVETTRPLPGEDEALAAFRASRQGAAKNSRFSLGSAKAAVAAAIGTSVLVTGGVSAAAAGVLPGAAQQTVSTLLKSVGISVPEGKDADGQREVRDRPDNAPSKAADNDEQSRDRSEEAPGARSNGDDAQCGRPEQPPGARGNEGGNQQPPGSRGNQNGAQCGRSEQAPGARNNQNGAGQGGRSEQSSGGGNNENGAGQGGRSEQNSGGGSNENKAQRGGSENTQGDQAEQPPADAPKASRSRR